MTNRERIIQFLSVLAATVISALLARYGITPPPIPPGAIPPPVVVQPPVPPVIPPAPAVPQPDPWNAIVRLSFQGVGCSATIIGPQRTDGTWWVLTAAHCVQQTGQTGTIQFRDGATAPVKVVNFERRSDCAWMVTTVPLASPPYALLADASPPVGTKVFHGGYGVDRPGNREEGTVAGGVTPDGQLQYRLSVSSGDSGGGICITADGRVLSPVCCTSRRGAVADVYGASPESCRRRQVMHVELPAWTPIEIPLKMTKE